MHLIRAIAFATAAAAGRVTPDTSNTLDMSNTSWWRLALAAPAISPDFALVSKHVCERGSTFVPPNPLFAKYFPPLRQSIMSRIHLRRNGGTDENRVDCGTDGLGHVGRCVVGMIATRRGAPGARYY